MGLAISIKENPAARKAITSPVWPIEVSVIKMEIWKAIGTLSTKISGTIYIIVENTQKISAP